VYPIKKVAPEGTWFKMLADQWRTDSSLLLNTSEECANEVKKGNRVYPDVSYTKSSIILKLYLMMMCNSLDPLGAFIHYEPGTQSNWNMQFYYR